jgi:hypothetical protein
VWKDVEEVLYGMNIKFGEFLGDARANPLKMDNGG